MLKEKKNRPKDKMIQKNSKAIKTPKIKLLTKQVKLVPSNNWLQKNRLRFKRSQNQTTCLFRNKSRFLRKTYLKDKINSDGQVLALRIRKSRISCNKSPNLRLNRIDLKKVSLHRDKKAYPNFSKSKKVGQCQI